MIIINILDDVCLFKTKWEALQPVSLSEPNYGISDSLLIRDGIVLGSNCDARSYDAPVALVINGTNSRVNILPRAGRLPQNVQDAIGAGPNLVSYDASTNAPFVNIPYWDFNVNIWEHAANTAVGLVQNVRHPSVQEKLIMVTADGNDSCSRSDPTCGIAAEPMAYFMKDYLKVGSGIKNK